MGDIAEVAKDALLSDGYETAAVPFPQNTLRDESGYRRELLKAVGFFHPDVVIPVGNNTAAARIKESVPGLPVITTDSAWKVEMLDSKLASSELASRLGIPQPGIIRSAEETRSFPVIFKRDVSFAGSGVYKPSSPQALRSIEEHFAGKAYMIEEYIEGCDWSVDAVRSDGFFRFGCYRSLASKGQGPSELREAAGNPALGRFAEMMLDAIDYHGVCGLDFRLDDDGKPYFLECNPRLTGGLATQCQAGFNIPSLLVSLFAR